MSATGIHTTEPRLGAEEIDWRQFWLTSVIVDSGKLGLPKTARYERRVRKSSLMQRLHKLRRMRATLASQNQPRFCEVSVLGS